MGVRSHCFWEPRLMLNKTATLPTPHARAEHTHHIAHTVTALWAPHQCPTYTALRKEVLCLPDTQCERKLLMWWVNILWSNFSGNSPVSSMRIIRNSTNLVKHTNHIMLFGTLYNFMHPIGSVMIMFVKVTKQFYLYKHFNNSFLTSNLWAVTSTPTSQGRN